MNVQLIDTLAQAAEGPSVTMTLNTHRTHPQNQQDAIVLKNLCKDAEERLLEIYGKRDIALLLSNLSKVPDLIDINHNLEGLLVFVSADVLEYHRSIWPVAENTVAVDDRFLMRDLIKDMNRSTYFLTVVISQSGVHLFKALNTEIIDEVHDFGFPFKSSSHYHTDQLKTSDAKAVDNMVREFLNQVDKAVVQAATQLGQDVVVIATEDNRSRLMQVADRPGVYAGYAPINYNQTTTHHFAEQGWSVMSEVIKSRQMENIGQLQAAVAQNLVATDPASIYNAAREGRGDLLVVRDQYKLPVIMTGESTFDIVEDATAPGVIDDLVSVIALEVISKKGRVVFVDDADVELVADMALKLRY
jgi:hypothetical protein